MIDNKLGDYVSRYRKKWFKLIFIKCTHCTHKIDSAGSAHQMHTIIVSGSVQ